MDQSSITPRKRKASDVTAAGKEDKAPPYNLSSLLSPNEASFSISIHPMLLAEFESSPNPEPAGCVVRLRTKEIPPMAAICSDFDAAMEAMESKASLLVVVKDLLECKTDDCMDILKASEKNFECSSPPAGYKELLWFSTPELLEFSLLLRLAVPMYATCENEQAKLIGLKHSFLDLLAAPKCLKATVHDSLRSRIMKILAKIRELSSPTDAAFASQESKRSISCLKELFKLLVQTDCRNKLQGTNASDSKKEQAVEMNVRSSYCIPSDEFERAYTLEVRAERQRILVDLERRKQLPKHQQKETHLTIGTHSNLPKRDYGESILLTGGELSYDEFIRQRDIMELVNQTLPRTYDPGLSRPRLTCVEISQEALDDLREIFFEKDGSLKASIQRDVDFTDRNGFINFAHASSEETRTDKRWQVPLRRHSQRGPSVRTRGKVENLLASQKLLDLSKEGIHDLGILIGGTEDQAIHHDIPRQMISWLQEDPETSKEEKEPIPGWEHDRAAYNEAMASTFAPSSLMLAMNSSGDSHLGVQKNQVDNNRCRKGYCTISNGVANEEFPIVRETEYLVVVKINPGVSFTGDFPHAGVRNVPIHSNEDMLMNTLYNNVQTIINKSEKDEESYTEIAKQIFDMMCRFPNLSKLCRFHCSTEPLEEPLEIPRNTIGFVDCYVNDRDKRFADKIYRSNNVDIDV